MYGVNGGSLSDIFLLSQLLFFSHSFIQNLLHIVFDFCSNLFSTMFCFFQKLSHFIHFLLFLQDFFDHQLFYIFMPLGDFQSFKSFYSQNESLNLIAFLLTFQQQNIFCNLTVSRHAITLSLCVFLNQTIFSFFLSTPPPCFCNHTISTHH